MNKATNPRASGVPPSTGASASHTPPLPTRQPVAFTLHVVYQVKAGITVLDGIEMDIPYGERCACLTRGKAGSGL